jgi:hypothetical protein
MGRLRGISSDKRPTASENVVTKRNSLVMSEQGKQAITDAAELGRPVAYLALKDGTPVYDRTWQRIPDNTLAAVGGGGELGARPGNTRIYIPFASMLLILLVLNVFLWLFVWLFNR